MNPTIFIDGHAGTIGLRIRELLAPRTDLTLLDIDEADRKDAAARRERLNACDVAILCLPDEAAVEAVSLVTNPGVRMIDGSTAHRVSEGWVYGLPELAPGQRGAVAAASRVSNPGCWATGVALLTRPLMSAGVLPPDAALSIHGVTGYSGGGKAMIRQWESGDSGLVGLPFEAPYAMSHHHKHLPEMQRHGRLATVPYFRPAVGAFARGMRVQVPLHAAHLGETDAPTIRETLRLAYQGERFVRVAPPTDHASPDPFTFDPRACNDTNDVLIRVVDHPAGHVLLTAMLDNLGKGASGAAVQSLNLMLGLDEARGLVAED